MSDSLSERYLAFIEQIVEITLKGQIRSKEQVYQMLVEGIEAGTGEIFERSLDEQLNTAQSVVKTEKDELKQAKANRRLRAIKTIQTEWERWQKENRVSGAIASAIQQILNADERDRLTVVLRVLDPEPKAAAYLRSTATTCKITASTTHANCQP